MDEQTLALLLSKGLIDQKAMENIRMLMTRGKTLQQAVVGARHVSDVDFAKVCAEVLGLPFVDLTGVDVSAEVIGLLPHAIIESYQAVPFGFDGTTIQIAMQDPTNLRASEALQFVTNEKGWKLQTAVVPPKQMDELLRKAGVGESEVETARLDLDSARGDLARAEAELHLAALEADRVRLGVERSV
ncbi:hypothetical protein KKF45_02295, partial [Patescibacteria group bacterium]|nr:hypothetical protein [Patescibacteria group bacterium]